jgi:excisionase family DNA binding protein
MPELLKVSEVAQYLRLDPKKIYAMIAADQIPGVVKFGSKSIRIHRDRLLDWVRASAGALTEDV